MMNTLDQNEKKTPRPPTQLPPTPAKPHLQEALLGVLGIRDN